MHTLQVFFLFTSRFRPKPIPTLLILSFSSPPSVSTSVTLNFITYFGKICLRYILTRNVPTQPQRFLEYLVVTISPKVKCRFHAAAILLSCVLQDITSTEVFRHSSFTLLSFRSHFFSFVFRMFVSVFRNRSLPK